MATNRKTSKRPAVETGDTQSQLVQLMHQVWAGGSRRRCPRPARRAETAGGIDRRRRPGACRDQGFREEALRGALRGVQDSLNERMGKVRGEAADAFENLEKVFRSRVHGALTQLGVPSAGEVEALSRRVDALNANIGRLARKAKPVPRARARRNGSHTAATH